VAFVRGAFHTDGECPTCSLIFGGRTLLAELVGVTTLPLDLPTMVEEDGADAVLADAKKRVGTTLRGKWTLERLIGVGGMGAVYEARHRNGMRGAVKVLDVALSRTRDCRKRFLREGRVANEVSHVGAVRVLDDDETEDGSAFLVMELLTGSTLDKLAMDNGGTLEPEATLVYAAQVLDTLVAAHERGIVHRDIKPENLLLTTEGVVKVLDFGIARWNALGESQRVTQAGEPIGTPAFMPPEQARGHWRAVDAQSDVYALGATMFTLVTGAPVHDDATTVAELLVSVITKPARPVQQAGEVPDVLADVIDKALSYDKRGRYTDALDMRHAIEDAYAELTGMPIPPTPTPSRASDAFLAVASSAKMMRQRLATTVGHRFNRARLIAAFAVPCAVIIACAAVVNANARTRANASVVASPPAGYADEAEIPPPPPLDTDAVAARDAVDEENAAPVTKTISARVSPVTTSPAPANMSRPPEPRPQSVSPLSRRSTLYDRRL
jgi:serine/threonine protein kinase